MHNKTKDFEVIECSMVEGIIKVAAAGIKKKRLLVYSDPDNAPPMQVTVVVNKLILTLSSALKIIKSDFKYMAMHKNLLNALKAMIKNDFDTEYLRNLDIKVLSVEHVISVTFLKALIASKLKETLVIANEELDPNLAPVTDLEKLQVNINELNSIINTSCFIPVCISSGKRFVSLDKRHAISALKLLQ